MKKSYAILEIKKALKDAGLKIPVLDNTLLEQDEFTSLVAVQAFDDLETIFKIYLGDAYNKQVEEVNTRQIKELEAMLVGRDNSIDGLEDELDTYIEVQKGYEATIKNLKQEIAELRLETKPQEIIHTHKFDKASRNAIVLAGYMSGRNGVGYSIINQGELNNDILKDAIE